MSVALRILLIVGAVAVFAIICKRVKSSKMQIMDSIYWIVLAAVLILNAVFPGIAITLANAFGFISASNFVFLIIIGLLLVKEFSNSADISVLKHKVEELAQEQGLDDYDQAVQGERIGRIERYERARRGREAGKAGRGHGADDPMETGE
ncbi:MAG: DUF2304 domain-containing protein [Atopobiaceae bacterium]|jgi:hypothetical protein|nr:DUF2304 domain-containing protein [Atopobiaceae bacterium]MCI2173747.1 DUF2304 domain-containing protein [Atopobiaceae bacterium]MCI2207611.1 DUF2304 domain-containing protein [Atopobiaceae bacterium]